jgi:DNA-directed RNA polymerase specialized sigma24 family protein
VESPEADPALAVEVEERFQRALARLSDHEAGIACLWLEGHSPREIADRIALSPVTVRKRLAVIRAEFVEEFPTARLPDGGRGRRRNPQ